MGRRASVGGSRLGGRLAGRLVDLPVGDLALAGAVGSGLAAGAALDLCLGRDDGAALCAGALGASSSGSALLDLEGVVLPDAVLAERCKESGDAFGELWVGAEGAEEGAEEEVAVSAGTL